MDGVIYFYCRSRPKFTQYKYLGRLNIRTSLKRGGKSSSGQALKKNPESEEKGSISDNL